MYCVHARKRAPGAPKTHFTARKISKFPGGVPQTPLTQSVLWGPNFCNCPAPPQSSWRPCITIWLQFGFPVHIWLLVGLVILISHYSQRFPKLLGRNPVSVLAALILLSYAKILRTLITAVYITYLEYPSNYIRKVWLHDANVDYLVGKHIPLFLMAVVVFLFLFLPYTLLLLFGQWLQVISHLKLFSWVNNARLKPFIDSYHAPYKAKHRYWPGVLLMLRFVLLLVSAFNHR